MGQKIWRSWNSSTLDSNTLLITAALARPALHLWTPSLDSVLCSDNTSGRTLHRVGDKKMVTSRCFVWLFFPHRSRFFSLSSFCVLCYRSNPFLSHLPSTIKKNKSCSCPYLRPVHSNTKPRRRWPTAKFCCEPKRIWEGAKKMNNNSS